jgi:hypothetical protein
MSQYTNTLMMIAPVAFRFNEQTAGNNYYQKVLEGLSPAQTQEKARKEFDDFVIKLRAAGITVHVIEDTIEPDTPDSIFPNNWVSFHHDATVILYPMNAENRRQERRPDILDTLRDSGLQIDQVIDMTEAEEKGHYLEGTGSIVLDRVQGIAYAAISERTEEDLFYAFCHEMDYTPCVFSAFQSVDEQRLPIYHTNVMMCVADEFIVICLDCIDDLDERHAVIETIEDSQKELIEISQEQVEHFAGNMLQVGTSEGKFLVMSTSAYNSLDEDQIAAIEEHCPIIHSSLDTIEACGGGSARCMMAEIFLPKSKS